MADHNVFPNSLAVRLIIGGGVALEVYGIRFPAAVDPATVLPNDATVAGSFGPVRFLLTPEKPAALRVAAVVKGENGVMTLEVELNKLSRVLTAEDLMPAGVGWFRIPLPNLAGPLDLAPGHVHVQLTAPVLALEFFSVLKLFDTVRLIAGAGARAQLEFNLFFRAPSGLTIGIPLKPPVGSNYAFGLESTVELEAELFSWKSAGVETGRFTMLENATGWSAPVIPSVLQGVREVIGFADRALLSGARELTSTIKKITLAQPVLSLAGGGLKLSNLGATIEFAENDRTLALTGPGLILDRDFHLSVEGEPRLEFQLAKDELLLGGGDTRMPLSILFAAGTNFIFSLDPRDPYVAMTNGSERPPATVYVPGLKGADITRTAEGRVEPKQAALNERFVLHFAGDEPGKTFCRITPHGAQMTATAAPRGINLGQGDKAVLRDVQLERGSLTLDRGDYELDIAASARLGYFERVSGRLTVRASSRADDQKFSARFDVQIEGAWEDPTGSLEFRDPGASVAIELGENPAWRVKAFVSGTLRFKAVERWLAGAAEWLGDLAKDLSVRFDRLDLHTFLDDPTKSVSLKMQSMGGRQIKLWNILRFELTELALARDHIVLAGKVHFTLEGGFYFMGGIPRMRISLKDGIDLMDDPGQPLTLHGKLVTPTGISAELELTREKSAGRQRLAGHGALTIPGWPGFRITCGFGKRRPDPAKDDWIVLLFLFVEADFPITLFPCVVLREMGLGFGINQKLRGFDQLWKSEDAFDNLMRDPRGLPNPAAPGDWEDGGGGGFTDVALVARTHVAPSPQGRGPFPYIADAMLYIQPTSEFTIAFTSNLWLFTGLDDVRAPAFRSKPVAQTLIVFYPRHGHLEARSRTLKDSKMSAAPDVVGKALSIVQTEMLLKATPDMFRLRVGLMTVELKLAGFDLRGSLLYGVEAGNGVALMLMQQQMSGSFDLDWRFSLSFGPLSLEVGLAIHARMGYSLLLAGGYFGAGLGMLFYGLARVNVSISLQVYLALRFYLRIKVGWFKITISWSSRMSASLEVAFEAEVEALLGTSGMALRGSGILAFRCCGFSFSPHISFSVGNSDHLEQVRSRLRPFLPPNAGALP